MNRLLTLSLFLIAAFGTTSAEPLFGQTRIELNSGTTLQCDSVQQSEDHRHLELRIQRSGIFLTRKVPLTEIATVNGQPLNGQPFDKTLLQETSAVVNVISERQDENAIKVTVPNGPHLVPFAPGHHFGNSVTEFGVHPCFIAPCDIPHFIPPGKVLSVREDPLTAYLPELTQFYPAGVPLREVPEVLNLMRIRKAQEVLSPPMGVGPGMILPGNPAPPKAAPIPPVEPAGTLDHLRMVVVPLEAGGNIDASRLLVEVRGFDAFGMPSPLAGTFRFRLRGLRERLPENARPDLPLSNLRTIVDLGTWTKSVEQRATTSARFLLPLRKPLPVHQPRLLPLGELDVQLLMPGTGVFQTQQVARLSTITNPVRTQLLFESGSPFFAGDDLSGSRAPVGEKRMNGSAVRPERRIFTVQP